MGEYNSLVPYLSQRIIILLQSGIGDLIMAIPLLKHCKQNLQKWDSLLILTESASTKAIIEHAITIDERISVICISEIWSGSKFGVLKLGMQLRSFRPTSFLLPHATKRLGISVFSMIVGAGTSVLPHSIINSLLFHTVANRFKEHKVSYYIRFEAFGDSNKDIDLSIAFDIPNNYLTEAKNLFGGWNPSQNWIGFAPGSGIIEAYKRWPISSYISLGKILLDKKPEFRIAIFGSPAETYLVNELKEGLIAFNKRIVSIIDSDIMVATAALRYCGCLVSACSGLAHLAAAVGTPVVGLYGPTNPGFTGPFSDKVRIVRVGLNCSPCYRIGFNKGCGNPVCMSMIEPELVEQEVMLALSGEFNAEITWHSTTNAVKPDNMNKSKKYEDNHSNF